VNRRSCLAAAFALGVALAAGSAQILGAPGEPAAAAENTYYVDREHASADDGNPGTASLPWATIQKAADTVNPGDTVYVVDGIYDERVMITRDGTPGAKIVFQAVPRRSVQVLHGFNISADAIRLEGFDITHDVGGWLGGGIWMSGHDVEIVDNYIHDAPGAGVLTSWAGDGGWKDVLVADNTIYGCNKGISAVSGDGWLVEGNEIERLIRPPSGGYDADYMRFFGINHVIRYNYLHGTLPSEVGTSHVDCFQTYSVNGNQAHNIVIEHNQCLDFVHQAFMMEGDGSSHSDITIRYNVVEGFSAWGVCTHNVQDLRITNNTWIGRGSGDSGTAHGVGLRDGSSGVIKSNIFAYIRAPYWHDETSTYTSGYNLTFDCRDEPGPASPTDLLDTDPLFVAPGDIPGPDGQLWTTDDGLRPGWGSPAADGGEGGTFIGAYAYVPDLELRGHGADSMIHLDWTVNVTLPVTATWQIDWYTTTLAAPFTATDPLSTTRAYTLTGLANYQFYTVTLRAMVGSSHYLSDTVRAMPTDLATYQPLVMRHE